MAEPFLGEIRLMSFPAPPKGWALCNGQFLPINQYAALFSLIGTSYGGNGLNTFALPNLQGRVPIHAGNTSPLAGFGGEEAHTLTAQEMPSHTHPAGVVNVNANQVNPTGNYLAAFNQLYQPAPPNTQLAPTTIATVGGGQPHENRQPYLVLSFAIALQGIYPSKN